MQPQTQAGNPALADVKTIIAVASGKGGVGKSTVASNLAVAMAQKGLATGLMDADIYGPSLPMMMGLGAIEPVAGAFPVEKYGLKLMSMGFIPDATKGVLLRGPMVGKYVSGFLTQIPWGALDVLVIDMPPGTGDAQLTLCQTAAVTGAVIVTTPQDVSLIDAMKALNMFHQLKVPVLGIIENMSYFVGDDGKRYEIFRHGGGRRLAEQSGVPFLGEIPIDPRVATSGDAGEPLVHKYPETSVAKAYRDIAERVRAEALDRGITTELPAVAL